MDLVVGATGTVGKQITLQLLEEKRKMRALIRGGRERAEAKPFLDLGAEIADGDLTAPDTLRPACAGIDTIVCTATSMPHGRDDGLRRVDHDGVLALIETATKSGVRKFIYTSYSGRIREDSPLKTAKRDCEKRLLASALQAVILRPSYFMEAWLSPALGFDPQQGRARIYGSGKEKVSYISGQNVVGFAVAVCTRELTERQVVLEIGGPEPLSQLEAVSIFEKALRKKITPEFIPLEALAAQHRSATDPLQKTFAALTLGYAKGDVIPESGANAERYGIRLRSVSDYANTLRA